jgi:hypothetical protein
MTPRKWRWLAPHVKASSVGIISQSGRPPRLKKFVTTNICWSDETSLALKAEAALAAR